MLPSPRACAIREDTVGKALHRGKRCALWVSPSTRLHLQHSPRQKTEYFQLGSQLIL